MKPTPTHSTFMFWLYIIVIFLNSTTFVLNLFANKPLLAICSFVAIVCFIIMGMDNFKKFFSYRKEIKAYKIEQKELELKRLEAAFTAKLKIQKAKELQEKFAYF